MKEDSMNRNGQSNERDGMDRRTFLGIVTVAGATLAGVALASEQAVREPVTIKEVSPGEDVFAYIARIKGGFDQSLYQQVIGAANAFKEGDQTIGVGAKDDITVVRGKTWSEKKIDHDITKLVCNIADTALSPRDAARETITIIRELVGKKANSSRRFNHF